MDWLAYPAVGSAIAGLIYYSIRTIVKWSKHQEALRQEFHEQLTEQMGQVIRICTELNNTCPRGADHAERLRQIEKELREIKRLLFGHDIDNQIIPPESTRPKLPVDC